MTKQIKQLKTWACYIEERDDADLLPPEREATEEDLYVEKLLKEDKNQQRWEAQARRAGLI